MQQPTADLPSACQGSPRLSLADKPQPLKRRGDNEERLTVQFGGKPALGSDDGDVLITHDHASALYSLQTSGSRLPISSRTS